MMLVLFHTYTSSIAIVGTSAIMMRRSAFAIGASTPTRSNSIADGVKRCTDTIRFFLKLVRFHEWSSPG